MTPSSYNFIKRERRNTIRFLVALSAGGTFCFTLAWLRDVNCPLYELILPLLIKHVDPEKCHKLTLFLARNKLFPKDQSPNPQSLQSHIGPLKLINPLGLAAGMDKDAEAPLEFLNLGFGFIEVGSIVLNPQPGNPKPRFWRIPARLGLINRYGFNSKGVEVAEENLKRARERQINSDLRNCLIGVSIGKNKDSTTYAKDLEVCLSKVARYADYIAINVSSPNTKNLRDFQKTSQLNELINSAKKATSQLQDLQNTYNKPPLICVKISPDLEDEQLKEISRVALESKLDGLIVCNTKMCKEEVGGVMVEGGLSGLPLRDISTNLVHKVYKYTEGRIPLIAVGGVFNGEDVLKKIEAGASACQIFTGMIYQGPSTICRIKNDLHHLLLSKGMGFLMLSVRCTNLILSHSIFPHHFTLAMGVGHFFRYIAERYPLICQQVSRSLTDTESAFSEFYPDSFLPFDALYIDMNGIVHTCAYSNLELSHGISSLDDIWSSIFQYLTKIVNLAKPRKFLYIAVDGVAPRAKINQQRARRFRTIADFQLKAKTDKEYTEYFTNGYDVPIIGKDGFVFDPTCVTPGTAFMQELTVQLENYVSKMIESDDFWSSLKVVISGANVPGEGEHKIAEYIRNSKGRFLKSHCVYGLDADLIMLCLIFHEPYICLLRESVVFSKMKNDLRYRFLPKDDSFTLLHVKILREYLARELLPKDFMKDTCIARAIDDFILICMLLGNDFLPHLKFLQIPNGGLTILLRLYHEEMEKHTSKYPINYDKLPWIINTDGEINVNAFYNLLLKYRKIEDQKILSNLKCSRMTIINNSQCKIEKDRINFEKLFPNEPTTPEQWANRYYYAKMGITGEASREAVVIQYLTGLQWVLYYYYQGVPDWSWCLECPYPPLARDMAHFIFKAINEGSNKETAHISDLLSISFKLHYPFSPYEQLLSVLPRKSSYLLPPQLGKLMTDDTSPLYHYYSEEFDIDMDDTLVPWGGVPLLLLIDFTVLSRTITSVLAKEPLSFAEEQRNTFGSAYMYSKNESRIVKRKFRNPSKDEVIDPMLIYYKSNYVYNFWFPSLNQLRYTVKYKMGVNVFSHPSYNESMFISPKPTIRGKISRYAFVGYPYSLPAQVYEIITPTLTFDISNTKIIPTEDGLYSHIVAQTISKYSMIGITTQFSNDPMGVDTSNMLSLVNLGFDQFQCIPIEHTFISCKMLDDKINPIGDLEYFPIFFTRFIEESFHRTPNLKNLDKCQVVYIRNGPLFGFAGRLLTNSEGNITAHFHVPPVMNLKPNRNPQYLLQSIAVKILFSSNRLTWYSFESLCERAEISFQVGEMILTSVQLVVQGIHYEVGMGLCAISDNETGGILCLPGLSNAPIKPERIKPDEHFIRSCIFSQDALECLLLYKKSFPHLFQSLLHTNTSTLNALSVFDGVPGANLFGKKLVSWCESQPFRLLKYVPAGYSALSSSTIAELARLHDSVNSWQPRKKNYTTNDLTAVYSTELERYPNLHAKERVANLRRLPPCIGQYVVNVFPGPIPLGARGIVTGVYPQGYTPGSITLLELCLVEPNYAASSCFGRIPRLRGFVTRADRVILLPPFVGFK